MTLTLDRPRAPLAAPPPVASPPPRSRLQRVVRGPAGDPSWARPALLTLLTLTGVLYLWDLSASGYANSFYAASVQAGSQSWKALFFGSLDAGNSITVDKPPASLWIMGLSARIFGFNSWSLLVPQALEGVAAVGLLYGAVKRVAGPKAGLTAGAILALTPAAVLMFRFDNPDALLTLLLVAGAYAMTRALEAASTKWYALAGAALGFAFLTKMLQGWLVVPAFALVYLVAAPTSLRRRIGQTLLAGLSMIVAAGWWVGIVALWPASSRPYIGGSTNNSVLDLVFGYNGFGRLFGSGSGSGAGGGGGTAGSSFGGSTGLTRLFSSEMGNEISWLLPAALVALGLGLWWTRRVPRTDAARAALIMWGGWLLVTGLVFSYMKGVIHPYYTVALAPAIAAVVAIGGAVLWRSREALAARVALAAVVVAAGGWSAVLLGRTSSWHPELWWATITITVLAAVGLVAAFRARVMLGSAIAAGLIGTSAFGLATAAGAHTGSIPSVGPVAAQTAGTGGGMGGGMGGGTGGPGGSTSGTRPSGTGGARPSGAPSSSSSSSGSSSASSSRTAGGAGGATSTALTTALEKTTTTWAAAVIGDQSAAELELSSGTSVMAIGGWSGSDNSPTLAQFEAYVKAGRITYFIAGGQGGGTAGGTGSSSAAQITAWVKAHYSATTVGGTTVYVLTG